MTRRSRSALAQGKRATIKDVAHAAGVGLITVSRVLREPEKVSPSLRERVNRAIHELGYFANQAASGLASGASRIVPVLIPSLSHGIFVPFLEGVHLELDRHGYDVLLGTTEYEPEVEDRLVATLLGWFPAGMLIAGTEHTDSTRQRLTRAVADGTPVVEYMELAQHPIDINVGMSHRAAGAAVARYFAAQGHKHIAYAGTMTTLARRGARLLAGFSDTLAELGLPSHYECRAEDPFSLALGGRLLDALLERYPRIEAIFFANDDLAAGAVMRAHRRKIAIPQRLAIMGFNDLPIAAALTPSLSSVRTDQLGMGRLAARRLIEALAGNRGTEPAVDTGFQIVERETSATDP